MAGEISYEQRPVTWFEVGNGTWGSSIYSFSLTLSTQHTKIQHLHMGS